jgi:sugar diacid utilization regulator
LFVLIPLKSNREALKHLTQLNTISRLADLWAREIAAQYRWGSAVGGECSVSLFSAVRASFVQVAAEPSREFLTYDEFKDLLEKYCRDLWMDALRCFRAQGISIEDALSMSSVLREIIIKDLEETGENGFEQLHLLVFLFDWVKGETIRIWKNHWRKNKRLDPSKSLDIEDLRTIVDSVRSPVDLRPVFQLIVDRVRNSGIWPMCAIGITTEDDQEIRVPAQSGFDESYPKDIKFPASGSATLETIRRNQPIAISDVFTDREFPVLQQAARAAGYRSILLLPLILDDLQGVVTFGSPEPHHFSDEEITLANAIAQQVLIAIENARHYEHEKQRVEQLEKLNQMIAEQNRLLQRSADTHTALTHLVLDDAGMDGILKALRALLDNPVAIENEYFQLLGYSDDWDHFDKHRRASIEAGGTAPEVFTDPEITVILDALRQNRRAVLIPKLQEIGIEKRRIVAPILAGGDILGYVWVMESLRPFEDHDFVTVEQAALVLALEMMKQRASYETELRLKADFLDDLLSDEPMNQADLFQRASVLGYNLDSPSLVLVVDSTLASIEKISLEKARYLNRQAVMRVQQTVSERYPENLVANQSSRILVIVPIRSGGEELDLEISPLAQDIHHRLRRIDPALHTMIGVGNPCGEISEIRTTYRQACRAIDAARSLGRVNETIRISDLGIYGLLFREDANDELRAFALESLSPLIDYDRQYNTDLLTTLDRYLTHQGKLAETARNLYIHVNTLRQRLERIEDVLEIDLQEPMVRLNLQLALSIYNVAYQRPMP